MFRATPVSAARAVLWISLVCIQAVRAGAQEPAGGILDLSLEDLLNVEVTSVSRRAQSLRDAPSAIHVVTAEDIRRIGATSIPEALRIVPGVQVSQLDSSRWAVSIRGFNNRFNDKLLVMIDGRSV